MDKVVVWASPLTMREVLLIAAGCAIAMIAFLGIYALNVGRRLRTWAREQGYALTSYAPTSTRFALLDDTYRVTMNDAAGNERSGCVCLVGLWFWPERLEVQWDGQPNASSLPRWTVATLVWGSVLWVAFVGVFFLLPEMAWPSPNSSFTLRTWVPGHYVLIIPWLTFVASWSWRRFRNRRAV